MTKIEYKDLVRCIGDELIFQVVRGFETAEKTRYQHPNYPSLKDSPSKKQKKLSSLIKRLILTE